MRITVPRIRIALLPVMFVTLLIRPASNTDNAKFYETAKTYSELFEVIGTLLRDHLTELNVFEKALSPKSHVLLARDFPDQTGKMIHSTTSARTRWIGLFLRIGLLVAPWR